ncbi:alpha/beta hydrolase [Acinetobacter sp. LoGeW2-3]|uniref:alpha/beta fold hydrolase n=1 Tax=Acinetobacter sp. LoGeW2-3 TaxID=1808001 RepID=UPI000C0595BA|nr:alpha/beta fold hydrolase [Acinetobacter sp. LoGeW2-3]ATO18890.1 alpha/beta hydrolase [Acinetobacter sp. LoGeW2-3]
METQPQWVATSDQQRLAVRTFGDMTKPALVLVHGYPDHQEVWKNVILYLKQDYFIVTYDVRSAGDSSIPKYVRDYRLERLSLDLEEVVNTILPGQSFHLAAHDWGSIQSWESVTDPRFEGRILSFTTMSGPCLDHVAFWMRNQFKHNRSRFFKQLSKSWYIAMFQLPWLAPAAWNFFNPERWSRVIRELEGKEGLPLNQNIVKDGKYGVSLYRANFIPRLLKPRERYAICPVQAIVLKRDNFVSPQLVDEMPKWVQTFSRVELDANHWAILSQPQAIANYIREFTQLHT